MNRTTHNLVQGSDAWHQHRQSHRNASEASAMMGASKYRPRADLLREKATGITPEVSEATQRLFDAGHAAEAAIRPQIELAIGDELYPVTMSVVIDGLPLSASMDGLNLDGDAAFEAKLWNEELAAQVRAGELDPHYYWQLEQILLCSGAERVIFATGDGSAKLATLEYTAVPGRADTLIAGWRQFEQDLANYQPEPASAPKPIGRTPESLPALRIEARGMVTASNLAEFKAHALAVLGGINRQLRTDDDFANAESTVKWCSGVEDRLEAAKANVLAQMADVDAVCRTIDDVAAETRRIRLELDRLVKAEKEARKTELVRTGADAVRAHYAEINATLGEHAIGNFDSLLAGSIGASIKGLKTLSSMRDKIDAAVASAKIDASQRAERIRACIAVLAEHSEHAHLFADRVQLCATKTPDDLRNLASMRVAEHKQREEHREKLRAEEAARREREQHAEGVAAIGHTAPGTSTYEHVRSAAGAPAAQQPLQGSANITGVATGSRNDSASESVSRGNPPPTSARIMLGDINAAIAPLSITGTGLSQLGFEPFDTVKNAKFYRADELPAMRAAMIFLLQARRAA